MLSTSECMGVSALFWSHIIAVHSVATFAERVARDIDALASWRKLFQLFQLAYLLIICAICRTWSHWFWMCTSIVTLVRITMGFLQCVSINKAVSKADDDEPRIIGTECQAWVTLKLPAEPSPKVSYCRRLLIACRNIAPHFSLPDEVSKLNNCAAI